MSLIKYGIAAAVGYHFGQPHGRSNSSSCADRSCSCARGPRSRHSPWLFGPAPPRR